MTEPDYFTVMERSINYYSQKYDPEKRLDRYRFASRKEIPVVIQAKLPVEKVEKKKTRKKFAALFSF